MIRTLAITALQWLSTAQEYRTKPASVTLGPWRNQRRGEPGLCRKVFLKTDITSSSLL